MNPWKMTAIGMALVATTALVTGLVVANWSSKSIEEEAKSDSRAAKLAPEQDTRPAPKQLASTPTRTAQAPAPTAKQPAARTQPGASTQPAVSSQPVTRTQPAVPTQEAVDACNQQAAAQTGHNKTVEIVKDVAIGTAVGAAVGAAGGAVAGGGKGAGKGAIIGGIVGAGGGTLYGINENRKADERYREAYGTCMRNRGYAA